MEPEDQECISRWSTRIADGAHLRLTATSDGRVSEMQAFCERLTVLVPSVSFARQDASAEAYPAILLPNGVRYRAVPKGNELEPFMEVLAGKTPALEPALHARLGAMRLPASLELYVMPGCPQCPRAARQMATLAEAGRLLQLTIVDAALFPEAAAHQRIRAVPTALLDERFRWTGEVPVGEVVELLATRDPATLGPASIETMLKQGSARQLAELMEGRGMLFPALLELLRHPQWPTRLGAMVTVEELHVRRPDLAFQVLEDLWRGFKGESDPVKGDILYLCGEFGDERFAPRLRALLEGSPPAEIAEAAADALEKLSRPAAGDLPPETVSHARAVPEGRSTE